VYLDGTQFYGGVTLILPQSKWVGPKPIFSGQVFKTEDQVFTPIGVYFTHRFTDRIAAGIGVTNPFGLGLKWSNDFPGRVVSKNVDLRSFYFSPVIAFQLTPNLSISGGVDLVYSNVLLERNILVSLDPPYSDPGVEVGEVKMEGNSKLAAGFSASFLFKSDPLSVGFLYRHKVKNKFENAEAKFKLNNDYYTAFLNGLGYFVNQNGSTEITYPNYLVVGAHYQLSERLGLEVDYHWFHWSVFDELKLDFEKDALDQSIKENYQDSYEIRVGAHFDVTDNLTLRAGYIRDNTPQPIESVSPLLPDNDRNDFTFGLGYKTGKMIFDLGYMLVTSPERSTIVNGVGKNDVGFDGTYTSNASLYMFSWGISF
jgi:long-chain fatty acid transport protein